MQKKKEKKIQDDNIVTTLLQYLVKIHFQTPKSIQVEGVSKKQDVWGNGDVSTSRCYE